jgi:hypothetical protein
LDVSRGLKCEFGKFQWHIHKIAGALVKKICNLEKLEVFMCKIGGLGLIRKYNSKSKDLYAKSTKGLGMRIGFGKFEGLSTKCQGKTITGRIIFLKKNSLTTSMSPWMEGFGVGVWSTMDRVTYSFMGFNRGHPIWIQRLREKRDRQRRPVVAQPGM